MAGVLRRLARRGNARAASGFLRNWKIASSDLTEQRDVALQRPATVCWLSLPALSAAPQSHLGARPNRSLQASLAKATERFADDQTPHERIAAIDDEVLFKVKAHRWRGAI